MKTGQIVVLVILFSILLGLLAIVVVSPMLTDRFEDEAATVADRPQTVPRDAGGDRRYHDYAEAVERCIQS